MIRPTIRVRAAFGIAACLIVSSTLSLSMSGAQPAQAQDAGPTATPIPLIPPDATNALSDQANISPSVVTATIAPAATPVPPAVGSATIHVVQRGETLFRIAVQYGTTVEAIAEANGIRDLGQLSVGQRLLIPNVGSAPSGAPTAANVVAVVGANGEAAGASGANPSLNTDGSSVKPGSPLRYMIQPGDSLLNLSWQYSVDVNTLARLNNILNPLLPLTSGVPMLINQGANGQPAVKNGRFHLVQQDDTLYRISARYGVSMALLAKVNRLGRVPLVFPGQRLVIPTAATGPTLMDVPSPFDQITMLPSSPEQGRTMVLKLTTNAPTTISGQFIGKPLADFQDDTRTKHAIVFGIDAMALPGLYPLTLNAVDDKGSSITFTRNVVVADGGYASETIALPPDQMDLLDAKFTQPELNKILAVVTKYSAQNFLNGPMGLPCAAAVTSQFGTRRSYNGGAYNQFHTGTDFAALPGSPIYAPAGGVIVMAATLNVRGNATIIDHGHGVFTGYWHQSEVKVKVGDIVTQGQVIGLVGGTGRATGPHLHWELFVGGVQVDPLQWTKQNLQ
jgi:murein DD-endopeptidase MepM/ murein hydrolase activator NlpD